MRYYVDDELNCFLEENIEAVIELIKKAYVSTKEHYKNNVYDDFLYFDIEKVFTNGYCFYFARVLKSVYKNAKFVVADKNYAHISHIFILINNEVYDIKGKRNLKNYFVLTNIELKIIDKNHNRINDDIYKTLKCYFNKYLVEYIKCNRQCITRKV